MARPVRQLLAPAAPVNGAPIILNNMAYNGVTFNVSLQVIITGTATYTVQYTQDDVFATNYDPSTGSWFSVTGLIAQTASGNGSLAAPVTAVRLAVTAWTSGTLTFVVLQQG